MSKFSYYTERVLTTLRDEGIATLLKKSKNHLLWSLFFSNYDRFKLHTIKNRWVNRLRYDAPADPLKTINIRPKNITYIVRRDNNGELLLPNVGSGGGLGQIRGGNWDSPEFREEIKKCPHDGNMYFVERFEDRKCIEETSRYQHLVEQYRATEDYEGAGFNSPEKYAKQTLKNYDNLFKEIKNNGYQSKHSGARREPHSNSPVQDKLETLVTIDRWGNINHWEGQHRKGIARVLDLEIPAHVICRHKKWQELRDDIYNNGFSEDHSEKIKSHPDIQDIINMRKEEK